MTEQEQLAAVTRNSYAIKYITNPSEKVQLVAVTKARNLLNLEQDVFHVVENNQHVVNNVEDAMIEVLDNMVELGNTSDDTKKNR